MVEDFRSHFRLSRGTVELIVQQLGTLPGFVQAGDCPGRERVPIEKQLLVAIWLLGNQETFRSVCDRFDLARSTTHVIFKKVSNALCSELGKTVIRWPRGQHLQDIMEGFRAAYRFPRIVGVIDGTYIPITAPKEDPLSYVNRKGYHCIVLQGVCDHEMLFTSIFAGFPGSVHDARVLRRSSLMNEVEADPSMFPQNSHLLGDSAYPLRNWLMVPFKDNGNLTQAQQRYNRRLSSARSVIERAFALLKGRFRRLKMMDVRDMFLLCSVVVASCVLHNLYLLNEDYAEEFLEPIEENDDEPPDDEDFPGVSADEKRQTLVAQFAGNPA